MGLNDSAVPRHRDASKKESDMPNVVELKETHTETQEFPACNTLQSAQAPRWGLVRIVTDALKGMRHSKRADQRMACRSVWEMPLDTLAREHPYMYAAALLA
jgi:hypothetical protein